MGSWAKNLFGADKFEDIGIVIAGTNKPEFEKEVLGLFDEVVHSKDSVYHAHLVKKNEKLYPIVFNVYGAPAMVDVLSEMHDGGCRTVIFIGYAYGGFKNLDIARLVVIEKSYHFDGIYHPIEPDRKEALPDKELKKLIEDILNKNKIKFVNGVNVSVPAVTFQMPHANKHYKEIAPDTCEMELASCLSRAKDLGMRSIGILIISDNRKISIGDQNLKKMRSKVKMEVISIIVDNIKNIKLSKLKVKKEFKIDEHLAYIIHDPNDETNVYK